MVFDIVAAWLLLPDRVLEKPGLTIAVTLKADIKNNYPSLCLCKYTALKEDYAGHIF